MNDSNSSGIESIQSSDRMANNNSYEELNANQLNANQLNNIKSINGNTINTMNTKNGGENGVANGRTIEVSWRNLVYTVQPNPLLSMIRKESNKSRTILKGLSGYFRSGNLTAIMGPSGAGKSTLLECVSGFRKKGLTGDVRITGSNRIKIGLIAQNDQLLNQLTVKEALIFASKLKNYKQIENKELDEVVVEDNYAENQTKDSSSYHDMLARHVIKQLGLEVCADTKSGNCSGGQRKRLSIALELISKPNILILDEPTSGLDSSACFQTVSVMQDLTQQTQSKNPIAVVATIHQPSARVFNLFHHVYVISFDGQCIYQGSPQQLISQLANAGLNCPQFHNPADFIAEVASGEYGHEGIVKLAAQKKQADSLIPTITGPKSLTLAQISQTQSYPLILHTWLLFWRSLLVILRDPMLTSLRFASHLVTAVFIGLLYGDAIGKPGGCPPQVSPLNDLEHFAEFREKYEKETITITENVAFVFFTLMFIMFGAMMPTIMTFPMDMQVFRKERTNGWYSCATYYMAKTLADMPFQFRDIPFHFKLILFTISIANFIFSYIWEVIILQGIVFTCILPKIRSIRAPIHPFEKIEAEMEKSDNWPPIASYQRLETIRNDRLDKHTLNRKAAKEKTQSNAWVMRSNSTDDELDPYVPTIMSQNSIESPLDTQPGHQLTFTTFGNQSNHQNTSQYQDSSL